MRVRKVINLYLNEPAHVELLEYLEGIEGDSRRQQALVQMALIGYRVIARHESGDEALFRTRNPDLSRLLGQDQRRTIQGIEQPERKPYSPRRRAPTKAREPQVIAGESHQVKQEQAPQVQAEPVAKRFMPEQPVQAKTPADAEMSVVHKPIPVVEPLAVQMPVSAQEQEIEELDPLALLASMDEG